MNTRSTTHVNLFRRLLTQQSDVYKYGKNKHREHFIKKKNVHRNLTENISFFLILRNERKKERLVKWS